MKQHAQNSVVSGGFLLVQKSTSYNLETGRQGPTWRRGSKGGVSGPAEDLRPVSEVEAGVNFRLAGGIRRQVAGPVVKDLADCSTCELLQRIEEVTWIPQQYWYCYVNGSPLPQGSATHGLQRDCTVVMCARLEGGAPTIPERVVLPSLSTRRVLASAHTLFQVRLQERGEKHFAARSVNVRLWDVHHPHRDLLDVPRSVDLHPSRGPENLPMPNTLNRPSWGLRVPWASLLSSCSSSKTLWLLLHAPENPAKWLLDLEIKLDKVQKEADRLGSVVLQEARGASPCASPPSSANKAEVQQVVAAIDRSLA